MMYKQRVNKIRFYCLDDPRCPEAPSEFVVEWAFAAAFIFILCVLEVVQRCQRGKEGK